MIENRYRHFNPYKYYTNFRSRQYEIERNKCINGSIDLTPKLIVDRKIIIDCDDDYFECTLSLNINRGQGTKIETLDVGKF